MRDLSKLALIYSHNGYWRKNQGGYTNDISRAGIYDRAEAEKIAAGCGPEKGVQLCPVNADHPVIVAEERDRLAREVAELKIQLAVRVFVPGFPSRPVEARRRGVSSAFDTGYELGWRGQPFKPLYTRRDCEQVYRMGWEQGKREADTEIARLREEGE